ncbi:MAG: YitT family protein [Clostridiales bacterium]|nr:YitT family protein [Clostridiales bacterium]
MRIKIKKCLLTALGGLMVGSCTVLILAPANLAPGGISGLSVIINHIYKIPIWFTIMLANIPIFILGYFCYGNEYIFLSFVGMLSSSLASFIFSHVPNNSCPSHDLMLFSVIGGTIMGFGTGTAIKHQGGTGGTDIIAKFLNKRIKNLSLGRASLLINFVIIGLNGIVMQKLEIILYSCVSLFAQSKVIDMLNEGVDYAKIAFIISEENEKISNFIINELHRGVTALDGNSMYTRDKKIVLMSVIKKNQINKLKNYIKTTDINAFVILSDSREVLGRGFKLETLKTDFRIN